MNRRTSRKRNARAFTLIEIIAVLVIIGMMVGFGVPMVMNHIENAKQQEAKTQTNTMYDAMTTFYMNCNRFPTEQEGLDALLHRPADIEGWSGPYIQKWTKIPKDPWGRDYDYVLYADETTGREEPQIISLGRDKQQGGAGLNADIVNGQVQEESTGG